MLLLLWLILLQTFSSLSQASFIPVQRYRSSSVESLSSLSTSPTTTIATTSTTTSTSSYSPSLVSVLTSYAPGVEMITKVPFDPNNRHHWMLVFHKNKIIMKEAFERLDDLLASFPDSSTTDTVYEMVSLLFSGSQYVPEWYRLFFRAAMYNYFRGSTDSIMIEQTFNILRCFNCLNYYRRNKSSFTS